MSFLSLDELLRYADISDEIKDNIEGLVDYEVSEAVEEMKEQREQAEKLIDLLEDRLDAMQPDSVASGLLSAIRERLES